MAESQALEFSFPIDIAQLPASGRVYDLSADADARAQIAKRLDLSALNKFETKVTITPGAGGLMTVRGTLYADVVQQCVVSLEPVPATISEDFELAFMRESASRKIDSEIEVSADDDAPDALVGDTLDLGELAVEQLALLIDPYPRAPGAEFKNPISAVQEAEITPISPFAALAKLKKNNENK